MTKKQLADQPQPKGRYSMGTEQNGLIYVYGQGPMESAVESTMLSALKLEGSVG